MPYSATGARFLTRAIALLFAPLPLWAGMQVAPPAPGQQPAEPSSRSPSIVYSIISLGPDASAALLNEHGQAAFVAITAAGIRNTFFDGERLHRLGTLGGSYTWIHGLNNDGVVVGEAEDAQEHSNILAFRWTARGGMQALPGESGSGAAAIDQRGNIVGMIPAPGVTARAVRWQADGAIIALGPLPLSLSQAYAVNRHGVAAGFADVASGAIHATLWDLAGNATDLGTLGGQSSFALHINDDNSVAGEANEENVVGFFWSRNTGMLPIDVGGVPARTVTGLNNHGELVGNTTVDNHNAAFKWSLAHGGVPLPMGYAMHSYVLDINNQGEMVGSIERSPAEGGGMRAVRWPASAMPLDLNMLLHRPPAGLVLSAAKAINDNGAVLADSNAGLVLLRPGTHGSDAPVLGPINGLPDIALVGQEAALTLGFVDSSATQTHAASVTWSDACPDPAPLVREQRGAGQVQFQHRFCSAGLQEVSVRILDSGGRATQVVRHILVQSPTLAAVSGKGKLGDSKQHGRLAPPLAFTLWVPLAPEQRTQNAGLLLAGPFQFRSDKVDSAAISDGHARIEGSGRLNGRKGYQFVFQTAGRFGADHLHLRITHRGSTGEVADYDNGPAHGLPNQEVVEGNVTIRN